MSKAYNYFAIPFEKVPPSPPYAVWFASWSSVKPTLGTTTQAGGTAQLPPPFVVGATLGDLPDHAVLLGTGARSQCPPPPPLPSPATTTAGDYYSSVKRWIEAGTDPQMCSYFSIPFAHVPSRPPYLAWFATWSSSRPIVEPGMLPPFTIAAIEGTGPEGATYVARMAKDPPAPPPVLSAPETSLATYATWLFDRGS